MDRFCKSSSLLYHLARTAWSSITSGLVSNAQNVSHANNSFVKICCLSATLLEVNIEYAVSGNGDNVIGAKKYKLNLYFNPFKRADDQISIEQAAGEQSR